MVSLDPDFRSSRLRSAQLELTMIKKVSRDLRTARFVQKDNFVTAHHQILLFKVIIQDSMMNMTMVLLSPSSVQLRLIIPKKVKLVSLTV